MEYLDFSSVIPIIRKYINDERTVQDKYLNEEVKIDQMHLLDQIFATFCNDPSSPNYVFDNGQVCRWFNGQARISPRIISYYMSGENKDLLSADIEYRVFPLMYDSAMASEDLNTDVNSKALLASGSFSPLMRDFIFDVKTPRPCRHFCGRDTKLEKLHELLCSKEKVFVQGIAGIGKSELAKAYAKKYDKEYTNIMYITYSGDLKNDIANLDFADDVDDEESTDARFSRHHRFLRKLKADSLLIIDNFNTVRARDSILDVVLKYHCHTSDEWCNKMIKQCDKTASQRLKEIIAAPKMTKSPNGGNAPIGFISLSSEQLFK